MNTPPLPPKGDKKDLKKIALSVEKDLLLGSIVQHGGNKSLAAKNLGISRSSLYRKLEKD